MMVFWGVQLLLLFLVAVDGAINKSCQYLVSEGVREECRGVRKWVGSNQIGGSHLFYNRFETQHSSTWVAPKDINHYLVKDLSTNTLTCLEGNLSSAVIETDVPFKCAGHSHIGVFDEKPKMVSDSDCWYMTVTNFETDDSRLFGLYESYGSPTSYRLTVTQSGNKPREERTYRLVPTKTTNVGLYVSARTAQNKEMTKFWVRRQRCQGGKHLALADVDEQQPEEPDHNCWVIQVSGGSCGAGTWVRYFDDGYSNYRKWTPKREKESDLYYDSDWISSDKLKIKYDPNRKKWLCDCSDMEASQVKCIGATALWFVDRPWPSKYADWVHSGGKYTSDRYNECKMFRMLKAYGSFEQGYYVKTTGKNEYFNEERGVVVRIDDGKWAAKTKCVWFENKSATCRGNYKSHMTPYDNRWTCASKATYCGFITVTAEDTPAGPCQGRWRMWRNNVYGRFDMETKTDDQRIIDRKVGSNTSIMYINETESTPETLSMICKAEDYYEITFKVPRSRCFIHGTYYWNQVNYDNPLGPRRVLPCEYLVMDGKHKDCRGIWKLESWKLESHSLHRKEHREGGQLWYNPTPGDHLARVENESTVTCFEGLDTSNVREQNVPYKCAGHNHMTSYDQNLMDGSNDMHCQYVLVSNFETLDEELWGFYWQRHWDKKILERKVDQWGKIVGGRLEIYYADQFGIRVTGYYDDGKKGGRFFIRRKRCQGSKTKGVSALVYSDREERKTDDDNVYSHTCWTLKVTSGACGTGTWARSFYFDRPNQWWYGRWNPRRLDESDLYQTTAWDFSNRIYWDTKNREYVCDRRGVLTHAQVKCSGANGLSFVDRPLPSKYIDWLKGSSQYTSDRFGECKMFRMLKAFGDFQQGYYVQTSSNDEYFNDEVGVVLGINSENGKWAAKTNCAGASCQGAYGSNMDAYDPYWTCVSAASYCGYITVTPDDTPAGICQGNWRLWRNKIYTRFDQETTAPNHDIVDRKLGGEFIRLEILDVDDSGKKRAVCRQAAVNLRVEFDIPQSRCFTHGTFHFDQADYPSPFEHQE